MPVPILLPKFSEEVTESEIVHWLKREGDAVRKGDPVCEVTTDKVNMEVEAPADGTLYGIRYPAGTRAPVTGVIAYLLVDGEPVPENLPESVASSAPAPAAPRPESAMPIQPSAPIAANDVSNKVRATPAARRVARLRGIALEQVQGSGPRGRIQRADVEAVVTARQATVPMPVATASGGERRLTLAGKRRTIAQRMQASAQTAPHIFVEIQVDAGRIEALRRHLKAAGERVSMTTILVKACAAALTRFPDFNATLEGEDVTLWPERNICVAIADDDGLTAPVIRRADTLSLRQIQQALDDLIARARNNALERTDLTDGTFTVSNLGMYGVSRFTAILNPPQVAILAVGQVSRQFVPDENDQPVARSIMNLVLSVDHRWLDGAQVAAFLNHLRLILEEPALLAL